MGSIGQGVEAGASGEEGAPARGWGAQAGARSKGREAGSKGEGTKGQAGAAAARLPARRCMAVWGAPLLLLAPSGPSLAVTPLAVSAVRQHAH